MRTTLWHQKSALVVLTSSASCSINISQKLAAVQYVMALVQYIMALVQYVISADEDAVHTVPKTKL